MARSILTIIFPHGKHDVCRRMECNESLDQEEESQWYEQCGELVEKLDSYKASIELLSDNNDEQIQQFNQSLKLLKMELEFEEQKPRKLTRSDGVFYEASFIQSETKTYNFDKCGEGKDITKRKM
jgi:tRNA G10  N-methylase Trm11